MEDLKPCPFCGADAYEVPEYHYVMCIKCAVTAVSHDKSEDYSESCKMWNTRPIEDGLRAEIAALETELRGTGKILERMDKAGSWGVLVDIGYLQALEAKVKRLEAVRVAAQRVENMYSGPDNYGEDYENLTRNALRDALQAAGEESGHDPR